MRALQFVVNMVTGKKTTTLKYKTWGKSRSNRLTDYDYSSDRPIHVVICANNKKVVFNSKNNAEITVGELLKAAHDIRFVILCYCLMPDHLHIVVSPGRSGVSLSRFLNIFKGRTSAIFRGYGITNLWQRSAFDRVIRRDEDLKAIIEYILNNPVRKGIAEKADCYPYSRYFEDKIKYYIS